MSSKRFKFLSTETFLKLSQREKLSYLARATEALGKTLNVEAVVHPKLEKHPVSPGTLGAVLYANNPKSAIPEADWIELVRSIAAGDQLALHRLYERTHQVVFTLAMLVTGDREAAEQATLDVFCDVWRRAALFDAARETVLGWIMNHTRSRALDLLGLEQLGKGGISRGDFRPPASLQQHLMRRIAEETGEEAVPLPAHQWSEPGWEKVAPAISCKLLATDAERHRVSMLVHLAPGGDYPPHTHAGVEELHLLDGELWIDGRKLYPGDYNRAVPGTADKRVWSETGCTCVLITSTRDVLS
jgi:DNA-directed RNA polymerase specialized sigma24 family protein